ncbi:uncharacterized protein LOC128386836 [Panonychus citri]|uniref:uncharacterized protein LOC128386836 n=1 Tax=Panonychus citri TaxID=50023 RepID=UPI002306E011|nr:uncharacterized protein LOC128386836 [Panonychus citri]
MKVFIVTCFLSCAFMASAYPRFSGGFYGESEFGAVDGGFSSLTGGPGYFDLYSDGAYGQNSFHNQQQLFQEQARADALAEAQARRQAEAQAFTGRAKTLGKVQTKA